MRKTLALVLSFSALAYVGLAYADNGENGDGQNTDREQQREQIKQKFEQERESLKQEWEATKEKAQQVRESFKEEVQKRVEDKKNLLTEFKNKFTEDRCSKIEERVLERTSSFDEKKAKHQSVYMNLVNRISKFKTRFDAAGLDTKKLGEYLAVLQNKIDKFKTDYAVYITKLKESKSLTCGHSEGEFRGILVDARAELKLVHADAADIRDYVRTTILPEIKVLNAQMPEEQGDENKDEENKDENKTPDTTAPTVSIASPTNTTYTEAGTVTILVNAADNDKVEKVQFYDGGTLKGTDEETPYSYDWAITSADNGVHSWTAKAYDDADPANAAVSTAVTLTVTIP